MSNLEAERVITAVRFTPKHDSVAQLGAVLAELHDYFQAIPFEPIVPTGEVKRLRRQLDKLGRSIEIIAGTDSRVPRLPKEWRHQIELWMGFHAAAKAGRPIHHWEWNVYSQLCAFYCFAFDRKPAPTPNGPLHRFVNTFLAVGRQKVEQDGHLSSEQKRLLLHLWKVPSEDTFRDQVRAVRTDLYGTSYFQARLDAQRGKISRS